MTTCGQSERDKELLRKFAERFAGMALIHFPEDYESRKTIITSAIVAALIHPSSALILDLAKPDESL